MFKFDPQGNVVRSFGRGMFIWPHGLHIDRDGNVWVTDAASAQAVAMAAKAGVKAGHQVVKFSPDGQRADDVRRSRCGRQRREAFPLAELGSGRRRTATSSSPTVTRLNGNNRVMKFSSDGRFLMQWGKTGYAPGEFRTLHGIAIDQQGRIFVADRNNNRIQLFDQQGKHLSTWLQFGTPSGIAFDDKGQIYVADSESDGVNNPGWEQGIRIGDVRTGFVTAFILDQGGDPRTQTGSGPEFVAVDKNGNVFGGEPRPRVLRKYVKVR